MNSSMCVKGVAIKEKLYIIALKKIEPINILSIMSLSLCANIFVSNANNGLLFRYCIIFLYLISASLGFSLYGYLKNAMQVGEIRYEKEMMKPGCKTKYEYALDHIKETKEPNKYYKIIWIFIVETIIAYAVTLWKYKCN